MLFKKYSTLYFIMKQPQKKIKWISSMQHN